jgi:hypothetical protein
MFRIKVIVRNQTRISCLKHLWSSRQPSTSQEEATTVTLRVLFINMLGYDFYFDSPLVSGQCNIKTKVTDGPGAVRLCAYSCFAPTTSHVTTPT